VAVVCTYRVLYNKIVYLYFFHWIAEEVYVDIGVNDSKVGGQNFQDHVSSEVHLPIEVSAAISTGLAGFPVISVVEAGH